MYFICITIHTYDNGLVKHNMPIEKYYIRNKIYIYCNTTYRKHCNTKTCEIYYDRDLNHYLE